MSRFNEVCAAVVLCVATQAALAAGVEFVGEGAESPVLAASRPAQADKARVQSDHAVVSARRSSVASTVVRCWQEGRLIYETTGSTLSGRAAVALEMKSSNDGAVQLLDLKQGLCVIEVSTGASHGRTN